MPNNERFKNARITPINPFTPRQAEIFELMAQGYSYRQIADKLGLSPNTVKNHIAGRSPEITEGKPLHDPNQAGRNVLGIYGVIEVVTGTRPTSMTDAIVKATGDILFNVG